MGLGAAVIPGGNDVLILHGIHARGLSNPLTVGISNKRLESRCLCQQPASNGD